MPPNSGDGALSRVQAVPHGARATEAYAQRIYYPSFGTQLGAPI